MGIVYEAMDHRLKRIVAIKKMRDEIKLKSRERERFLREARTVAKLHHPNIVDIYDVIEEEGEIYLVFEFVQGKTVEGLIDEKGKISWRESRDTAIYVCDALDYAHRQRVIHRDLKPSNIMLTEDGHVKVMDFGIAREAKDTVSRLSGETSGTLVYMAPEQHLGSYDERTDIFSLGATMYEMLMGDVPFKGPDFLAQKERMIYIRPRQIVSELPLELEEVICRCLQSDPKKRFGSAEELKSALEKLTS